MSATALRTQRLTLRAPQAGDVEAWRAFFTSRRSGFIGGGEQCTAAQAWRAFAALAGHWTLRGTGPFILIDARDAAIGSVGLWYPLDWPEPELSWSIWDARCEGRGFALEAAEAVLAHLGAIPRWSQLVSYIDPNNRRSVALAERLGAQLDTTAARPDCDVVVYRHQRRGSRADRH